MSTELATSVPATHALDNIATRSVAEFRANALVSKPSKYTERARRAGKTDSVGHIGIQLSTDDIVDHVLTISSVCRASVPVLDNNGNPVWNCRCCIKEIQKATHGKSSLKKDAKKQAAYIMLQFVLKEEE